MALLLLFMLPLARCQHEQVITLLCEASST